VKANKELINLSLSAIRKSETRVNLLQYPRKILAPLIIHFANGRRQDKTFRKFIGAPQCHHSSFKLSFSLACSKSYRVAKKDQGSIGKGGGGKRKCPIYKIQRRVGNSSFSPLFPSSLRPWTIYQGFGSNPAGYRFACARPIFFTIFFLEVVFHAASPCGFYRTYSENNAI